MVKPATSPIAYVDLLVGLLGSLNLLNKDANLTAVMRGKEAVSSRLYCYTFLSAFAVELGLKALESVMGRTGGIHTTSGDSTRTSPNRRASRSVQGTQNCSRQSKSA